MRVFYEESLLISAAQNLSDFPSTKRLCFTEKIVANSKWENDGMGVMECRKSVSLSLSKLRAYRQYVFISLRSSSLEFSSRSWGSSERGKQFWRAVSSQNHPISDDDDVAVPKELLFWTENVNHDSHNAGFLNPRTFWSFDDNNDTHRTSVLDSLHS